MGVLLSCRDADTKKTEQVLHQKSLVFGMNCIQVCALLACNSLERLCSFWLYFWSIQFLSCSRDVQLAYRADCLAFLANPVTQTVLGRDWNTPAIHTSHYKLTVCFALC